MGKRVLHYFSTMRGFTNLEGGKGIVYYGVVCRIPRSEVDKIAGRGESIGTLTEPRERKPTASRILLANSRPPLAGAP